MTEKRPPRKKKSCLYSPLGCLAAIIGLGMLIGLAVPLSMPVIARLRAERKARLEQPFLDQMPAYTGRFRPAGAAASLQGKVLVIDPAARTVDELYHDLPTRDMARTPDEVGVLAWMECRTLDHFDYFGPGLPSSVDQEACKLTLIDWPSKTIVATREFTGAQPPDVITLDKDGLPVAEDDARLDAASVNREDVLSWLLSQIQE